MTPPRPVAVVDDSDETFDALVRGFSRVDPTLRLVRVHRGDEVLTAPPEPPLLVLLDLDGAGEGGLRSLHRLRNHPSWRAVPCVVMARSDQDHEIAATYVAGAAGYLVRALDPDELLRQLAALWTWWTTVAPPPLPDPEAVP
jgi:DNA-binding response OmpR family regulator